MGGGFAIGCCQWVLWFEGSNRAASLDCGIAEDVCDEGWVRSLGSNDEVPTMEKVGSRGCACQGVGAMFVQCLDVFLKLEKVLELFVGY